MFDAKMLEHQPFTETTQVRLNLCRFSSLETISSTGFDRVSQNPYCARRPDQMAARDHDRLTSAVGNIRDRINQQDSAEISQTLPDILHPQMQNALIDR